MADKLAYRIDPGSKVDLRDYPTDATGGMDKPRAEQELATLGPELQELQAIMWGDGTHALLMVVQGRDAAGKDGIISHVLTAINPQGLDITSFKVPSEDEAAHDFLWRKGIIGVFNRSHYEQVLVVRVHKLAPDATIEASYDQINAFERLLTDTGTLVVKFYLHLSRDEQRARLLAREQDVTKAWKLNPGDWAERELWDAYTDAYEVALSRCSTDTAPWYVIPSDHKWATHLGVARVLAETLRPFREGWLSRLQALQTKMLGELKDVDKK